MVADAYENAGHTSHGAATGITISQLAANFALECLVERRAEGVAAMCARMDSDGGMDPTAWDGERAAQCHLLRCVFGPLPFRAAKLDPAVLGWRDASLVTTARRIYERREFQFLHLLAQVLEEAGCKDSDLLNHCRQPGVHVRGCWVVYLLLGNG